jgi:hypothetical protein
MGSETPIGSLSRFRPGRSGYGRTMNRYFRRLARFGKSFSARRSKGAMQPKQDGLYDAGTPQDVTSERAKSQSKGKVTADKWNQ